MKSVIPETPFWVIIAFDLLNYVSRFRIGYLGGVQWRSVLQKTAKKDLQKIGTWIEEGKLKAVVGKVLKLEDIEGIRETCVQIRSGNGGIGKVVVEIC